MERKLERKRVFPVSRVDAGDEDVHWHSSRNTKTAAPSRKSETSNVIDTSHGASKRVLVLDDDEEITCVLTAILETQGYEVTTVNKAVEGLVAAMTCDFDAIICDMVMPNMPGDMYYVAVSRAKPHLCSRFVFITGHGSNPKVAEFLAKLQQPVLYKPFGMDELLEAVVKTIAAAECLDSPATLKMGHSNGVRVPGSLSAASESPASEVATSSSEFIVPI